MIRSMTGYGRGQQLIEGRDILVEIKSVNHRFFEFSARTPRAYGYLEEKLKSFVQEKTTRGKVEVSVTVITMEGTDAKVEINEELASSYLAALRSLGEKVGIRDDITLSSISRFTDIFTVRKEQPEEAVIWNSVKNVAEEALNAFVAMREVEGEKLKEDVLSRLVFIENAVAKVEELSPKNVENYRSKLYAKLKDILGDKNIDETRLITEAAIFSEKTAVDEETVRLRSHIHQFRRLLAEGGAIGRKLDFLVQELNRETNTIGSKAQDVEIARIVVDVKSEIEKIREQIQNIE